jgi:hypothetical protein
LKVWHTCADLENLISLAVDVRVWRDFLSIKVVVVTRDLFCGGELLAE